MEFFISLNPYAGLKGYAFDYSVFGNGEISTF